MDRLGSFFQKVRNFRYFTKLRPLDVYVAVAVGCLSTFYIASGIEQFAPEKGYFS